MPASYAARGGAAFARRRQALSAGVRRASILGAGLFKDAESDALVRATFFDGIVRDCQIVIPDFGTVEGPFQISSLEFSALTTAKWPSRSRSKARAN